MLFVQHFSPAHSREGRKRSKEEQSSSKEELQERSELQQKNPWNEIKVIE